MLDAQRLFDRGAISLDELRQAGGYQPRTQKEKEQALAEMGEVAQATAVPTEPTESPTKQVQELRAQEIRQWERKVLKRFPQVPPYAIAFAPEHLTSAESIAIRQALLTAETVEEVKAAFAVPFRGEWVGAESVAESRGTSGR